MVLKTVKKVEEAYYFIRDLAMSGEDVLFVGNRKMDPDGVVHMDAWKQVRCGICGI